jgi:hypothetical protein
MVSALGILAAFVTAYFIVRLGFVWLMRKPRAR